MFKNIYKKPRDFEYVIFVGLIGSGKSYQSKKLKYHIRVSFADELREMVSDLLKYDITKDYDKFKTSTVLSDGTTGRELLQRLGTDVIRKRTPDYFLNAWCKKVDNLNVEDRLVVVDDARFANEIETVLIQAASDYMTSAIFLCDYNKIGKNAVANHKSEELAAQLTRAYGYGTEYWQDNHINEQIVMLPLNIFGEVI